MSNSKQDSDLFPEENGTATTKNDPQESSNPIMSMMFDKPEEMRNRQFEQNSQMPFTAEDWTKSQNNDIVNNTENDSLDCENDIEIGRSVGTKAKNYDVMALETGEIYHLVEGTKIQNSEVFCGKRHKE